MFLKFIGKDGSCGLRYGQYYKCEVSSYEGYIWVRWDNGISLGSCPYATIAKLADNWR